MTYETLRAQLAKKPFEPFKVVLTDGEEVEISRPFQAVPTVRNLFVATGDYFRSILMHEIRGLVSSGHRSS